jgi:hypothetical protein
MRKLRHIMVGALCAAGALLPVQFLAATAAQATTFTGLTLINGWTGAPFSTAAPSVTNIGGIVHFRGAIATSGTNPEPFVLPASFRPAANVYVPVDMCNATNGRLDIAPSGVVTVEQQNGDPFANAQCFTSLDGATFALSATGFTALTLQNGWTNAPFGTSSAAVRNVSGIIRFKGAVASGTSAVLFTLPASFRPATDVYVPVDLCNGTNGRLHITPSGAVDVEPEGGSLANAQCFTSLDGASFATSASGFRNLTLQNGWTGAPFSTSVPAAADISGVVQLKGAIATSGTNPVAFTLPDGLAPGSDTYVKVDLCNATNGRLFIHTDGTVTVQQKSGDPFVNAQCFTSLDGVSFVPGGAFGKLALVNGWTGAPFSTSAPAASVTGGIVQLSGAMATSGTNPVAFTLPAADRPATSVYVPVDLCNATNGRLLIQPSGVVTVQQQDSGFGNAQCFTSLEGASFATSAASFTALTLQNGWTNAPFSTSSAAVRLVGGIVRFKGAVASGTSAVLFTLTAGFRPSTDVYVPVDLCNAKNGRLHITPSGAVDVQVPASESFADAQCFTSLDGASFARSASVFTALTPQNGWTNAPFSTSNAAAALVGGTVHLKGAVASGTSGVLFTLPSAFRPARAAYAKVDLCNATNGRLFIQPSGVVTVQQQNGDPFSNAQCFTSLDGATFAP